MGSQANVFWSLLTVDFTIACLLLHPNILIVQWFNAVLLQSCEEVSVYGINIEVFQSKM